MAVVATASRWNEERPGLPTAGCRLPAAETNVISLQSIACMSFLADVRHAFRGFGRSPIFAATSIASLAIGLAASATIYSLTDALVFAPSPGMRNASEIVDIGRANGDKSFDNMSHPAFVYLRDHTKTLSGMAAVNFGG